MTTFDDDVISVIALLGDGEVVSYGDVAAVAGRPRAARAVGRVLSRSGADLPWWRVVYADGRLTAANRRHQSMLLRAEGVLVQHGRIVDAPTGRFARAAAGQSGSEGSSSLASAPAVSTPSSTGRRETST
ncbi:MAG: MGMT family protein [Actinomycetota bacterium]|nr:MGMT family protein [Actinomycetota bacterium]